MEILCKTKESILNTENHFLRSELMKIIFEIASAMHLSLI